MNKKFNTILFILGATAFNLIVTILCIVLLFVISQKFIMLYLPENAQASAINWSLILCFIGGIVLSYVIYRFALRLLMKKVNIENYMSPLFGGARRKPK